LAEPSSLKFMPNREEFNKLLNINIDNNIFINIDIEIIDNPRNFGMEIYII